LAQEQQDLRVQEEVMQDRPEDFQHDGGYAGPILGKQKIAGRAESPTSTGDGERKRQRGRVLAMLHAELGNLVRQEDEAVEMETELTKAKEEIERLKNKNSDLEASNSRLELKTGTLFRLVKDVMKQKSDTVRSCREEVEAAKEDSANNNNERAALLLEKERLELEKTEAVSVSVQLRSGMEILEQRLSMVREVVGGPTTGSVVPLSSWVLQDAHYSGGKNLFVFRFNGSSASLLESVYDEFRVITFKLASVDGCTYVFIGIRIPCTQAELETTTASVLGPAVGIEFISYKSRAAARDHAHFPRRWTLAMFDLMIQRLRGDH
jgi:hypothetical protein